MSRAAIWTMPFLLVGLVCSVRADPPPDVIRVRGIIDQDVTWSGTVLITDDVTIAGATVRVLPGTVIEFSAGERRSPTINVGGVDSAVVGRLEMVGAADQRILVRTGARSGRGRIAVTVRNRMIINRLDKGTIKESVTTTQAADQMNWRHVQFEQLGSLAPGRAADHVVDYSIPSVQVLIREGGQTVSLEDCAFNECSHLLVQSGPDSEVTVHNCRFEKPIDQISARFASMDDRIQAKSIRFVDNFASGMVMVAAGPAELTGNRMVGPTAGIAVRKEAIGDLRVESNYVHCTEVSEKGRYVLTVEQPDVVVRNNVLMGGAYVIHQGSRQMSGNVLVAAPRMTNDKGGKSRTLRLVGSLPANSTFEKNVLIGPALSLLGPQRPLKPTPSSMPGKGSDQPDAGSPTRVCNNVLDGFDGQTKAVQMNLPKSVGGTVELFDNLVLRCGVMVADTNTKSDGLAFADYNAIVGGPEKLFQGAVVAGLRAAEEGWSKHDQRFESPGAAGLSTIPETPFDFDEAIMRGAMTVSDARRRFIESYRVRGDSPLIGAGRPIGTRRGDIGNSIKLDK